MTDATTGQRGIEICPYCEICMDKDERYFDTSAPSVITHTCPNCDYKKTEN